MKYCIRKTLLAVIFLFGIGAPVFSVEALRPSYGRGANMVYVTREGGPSYYRVDVKKKYTPHKHRYTGYVCGHSFQKDKRWLREEGRVYRSEDHSD